MNLKGVSNPKHRAGSDEDIRLPMIIIRPFQESDAESVGRLIADTYSEFNLSSFPPDQVGLFLGPFRHAHSSESVHQADIAHVIRSEMVLVAEDDGEIVGVLRGRKERLGSLFVRADHQRQGVGRNLVDRFEEERMRKGDHLIKVTATLYAVPFYLAMGYRRSTGIRNGRSFEGRGLQIQPMKKRLQQA